MVVGNHHHSGQARMSIDHLVTLKAVRTEVVSDRYADNPRRFGVAPTDMKHHAINMYALTYLNHILPVVHCLVALPFRLDTVISFPDREISHRNRD